MTRPHSMAVHLLSISPGDDRTIPSACPLPKAKKLHYLQNIRSDFLWKERGSRPESINSPYLRTGPVWLVATQYTPRPPQSSLFPRLCNSHQTDRRPSCNSPTLRPCALACTQLPVANDLYSVDTHVGLRHQKRNLIQFVGHLTLPKVETPRNNFSILVSHRLNVAGPLVTS
jgi:hypothetical protein